MVGEFEELFEELLWGVDSGGAWIGLLMIMAVCFLVTYKVKYSGILFEIFLLFMAIEYIDRIPSSSNFMWSVVFCFTGMVLIAWKLATDVKR